MNWIVPADTKREAKYWLTHRAADCAPNAAQPDPDKRVCYQWCPSADAWWTGRYYRPGKEPIMVCLHGNNGWRIEAEAE